MTNLKKRLATVKKILKTLTTASSLMVSTTMILEILQYVSFVNRYFLPIPLIVVLCYITAKFLPTGISEIKSLVCTTITQETFTEEEYKELQEIKNIIEGKIDTLEQSRTREPIAIDMPVFVDEEGHEYVRRN